MQLAGKSKTSRPFMNKAGLHLALVSQEVMVEVPVWALSSLVLGGVALNPEAKIDQVATRQNQGSGRLHRCDHLIDQDQDQLPVIR